MTTSLDHDHDHDLFSRLPFLGFNLLLTGCARHPVLQIDWATARQDLVACVRMYDWKLQALVAPFFLCLFMAS